LQRIKGALQVSCRGTAPEIDVQSQKRVHLIVDGLPAHKKTLVKGYVASTQGKLTLHFLLGYAPDLNPDELVWNHVERTGVARRPLPKGEKLGPSIHEQLSKISRDAILVRSFFRHQSVRYISDLRIMRDFQLSHSRVQRGHFPFCLVVKRRENRSNCPLTAGLLRYNCHSFVWSVE
jgi:DDE superfamily endonuclease